MSAGKKPTPPAPSKVATVNEIAVLEDRAAANQLAGLLDGDQKNVVALALKLNYSGPLEPDSLEQIAMSRAQTLNQVTFEFGASLLLLREATLHGDWVERLARVGMQPRVAHQYMTVAAKFSNRNTHSDLKFLGKSKLLELVILDDEEVTAFSGGESVRGLVIDDVARMGVRELRAALREASAEKEASDKLLAVKDAKINKLSRHIAKATPDAVLLELQKEGTAFMNDALGCLRGQLRQTIIAINNHDEADHSLFIAGLVGQVQADLNALREEFNLPDISTAAERELAAEVAQWAK